MLFRPKERAWDREECLSEERQDERAARGRRKAERTLVPGPEGRILVTEQGGHRDGTILFPCLGLALSSSLGMRELAPSCSFPGEVRALDWDAVAPFQPLSFSG